jgi:hypothetical protein
VGPWGISQGYESDISIMKGTKLAIFKDFSYIGGIIKTGI